MTDTQPRSVVVGVDGRPRSHAALAHAVAVAREHDLPVRLVHVTPGLVLDGLGELARDVEAIASAVLGDARERVRQLDPERPVVTSHRVGARSAGIAASGGPGDLVVLGRSRHDATSWLPHGGLATGVVARARGPVLLVPEGSPLPGRSPRVVVAAAADGVPEPGLAEVFDWSLAHAASIAMVHCWWVPDPYVDLAEQRVHTVEREERGVRMMEQTLAHLRAGHPEVPVSLRVRHGRPAHVLLEQAAGADLLVLPRHRAFGVPHGYVGGTTRTLLRSSPVPVLVLAPRPEPVGEDLVLEQQGALVR